MRKIELTVINISSSSEQAGAYAMVLQEVDGDRQLPIIIGATEAQSIALQLKNITPPRPLTHDVFASALRLSDVFIKQVLIYKAKEGVFYSYIYIGRGEEALQIDARTSDAVAMAVRMGAPIYVFEPVLDREGITLEERRMMEAEEEENQHDIETDKGRYIVIDEDYDGKETKEEALARLQAELEEAVNEENYELASLLRDEILRRK